MAFKFETLINMDRARKVYALYKNGATLGERDAACARLEDMAKKAQKTLAELITMIEGKQETKFWDTPPDPSYYEFYKTWKEYKYEPPRHELVIDMDIAILFSLRVMLGAVNINMTPSEIDFINDQYQRFRDYTFSMRISPKQRTWLQSIYSKYRSGQNAS